MQYCADLHIHSAYSRGTSKALSLLELKKWALIKGVQVVGTGDFTHPLWRRTLAESLIPAGNGFYLLPTTPTEEAAADFWQTKEDRVYFCLTAEISSIYKKNGRVRKVHSIIFAPDLEAAEAISLKLEGIGNLKADGRPILGLDPKDLLEIIKDISPDCQLIPAHIWTPWFSLFGAYSGFDSLGECFEDLSFEIFALETGLSSDPIMNGRLSALDRYTLVSNSDAHSASKLMREANLFDTELSYQAMFEALKTGDGFLGTIEFFPEEGKYHYDGHRKCKVVLNPEETRACGGLCPVCGKELTVGVMHRVLELADRLPEAIPASRKRFRYAIPIEEVIAELKETRPTSKAVQGLYRRAVELAGNERCLLFDFPLAELRFDPCLGLALERLRKGEVVAQPGFDGEYGKVYVFAPGELERLAGQRDLLSTPPDLRPPREGDLFRLKETPPQAPVEDLVLQATRDSLQEKAVGLRPGAVVIWAGPGTGKTCTLTAWLAACIAEDGIDPEKACALTFTIKARDELRERLLRLVGARAKQITIATFHGLCFKILQELSSRERILYSEEGRRALLRFLEPNFSPAKVAEISERLEKWLETGQPDPSPELQALAERYAEALDKLKAYDVSGLVTTVKRLAQEHLGFREYLARLFEVIAVDEFQDCNEAQYHFLSFLIGISAQEEGRKALRRKRVLVIGDPHQAIYSFRGGDPRLFFRFQNDFQATFTSLDTNYRSQKLIVEAAEAVIEHNHLKRGLKLKAHRAAGSKIQVAELVDSDEEAAFIANLIQTLVGGIDLNRDKALTTQPTYSLAEIAVLARTNQLLEGLAVGLSRQGIPIWLATGRLYLNEPPLELLMACLRFFAQPADFLAFKQLLAGFLPQLRKVSLQSLLEAFFQAQKPSALHLLSLLEEPAVKQALTGSEQAAYEGLCRFLEFVLAELEAQGLGKAIFLLIERIAELKSSDTRLELAARSLLETARHYGRDLRGFLEEAFIARPEAGLGFPVERVPLLTFHSAKGLEFPVVILAGLEEGLVPLTGKGEDLEEERRLFYVALTRAKERLYLTRARRRRLWGKELWPEPSPFLAEIPACLREDLAIAKLRQRYYQPHLF